MSDPAQLVIETVAQLLDVDESALSTDTVFAEIENWDSVNALRVLVLLERELGASIDYEGFAGAHRIGDLARVIGAVAR